MKSPCKIWYTQHHLRSISQEFELGLFNNSGFTTKNSVGLCQEATKNKSRMIVNVATAAVIFCILKSIQKVFVVCIEMAFYKKTTRLICCCTTGPHTNIPTTTTSRYIPKDVIWYKTPKQQWEKCWKKITNVFLAVDSKGQFLFTAVRKLRDRIVSEANEGLYLILNRRHMDTFLGDSSAVLEYGAFAKFMGERSIFWHIFGFSEKSNGLKFGHCTVFSHFLIFVQKISGELNCCPWAPKTRMFFFVVAWKWWKGMSGCYAHVVDEVVKKNSLQVVSLTMDDVDFLSFCSAWVARRVFQKSITTHCT